MDGSNRFKVRSFDGDIIITIQERDIHFSRRGALNLASWIILKLSPSEEEMDTMSSDIEFAVEEEEKNARRQDS